MKNVLSEGWNHDKLSLYSKLTVHIKIQVTNEVRALNVMFLGALSFSSVCECR